jgi:hypothetical protein
MDLRRLSEDALIDHIESLVGTGPENRALMASLDELFRRIREEADPGDWEYVEVAIAHLREALTVRIDDEPGPEAAGVREPRRPAPEGGSAAAAVDYEAA